ncbi:EsaB/YukD family protein [Corynebacterium cystitidis]|uniref:EsaB/YukD family protein n=1 Tax=Corynebacterium cystitidis TaxID=35757 RepID=UPI00211DC144|nr:EsaB/YukD family protein [Corynebacterium cystitidis]
MSAMFVRVSVFHDGRQLDVSLPSQRPTVDITDDIVSLLSQQSSETDSTSPGMSVPEAHTWVLSSPTLGVIDPHESLDERGVKDGERLYLTSRHEAARSPFVDDAITEVRATVDTNQLQWTGEGRSTGFLIVASTLIAVFGLLSGLALDKAGSESAGFLIGCLGLSSLFLAGLAWWRPHAWMRWLGIGLPIAGLSITWKQTDTVSLDTRATVLISIVALLSSLAAFLAGRGTLGKGIASITASLIVFVVAGTAAISTALGADIYALSAWGAWLPILALLVAPTVSINSTGLAKLLRVNDTGEQIERSLIREKAHHSEAVSRGIVWAAVSSAFLIIVVLAASPFWQHGTVALLLSLTLILRTNGFADARIIIPLMLAGSAGLVLVAGSVAQWGTRGWETIESGQPWFTSGQGGHAGSWIVACIVTHVLCIGYILWRQKEIDELEEARIVRVFSAVDIVVSVAIIPVILAAQGVFTYYWVTT